MKRHEVERLQALIAELKVPDYGYPADAEEVARMIGLDEGRERAAWRLEDFLSDVVVED